MIIRGNMEKNMSDYKLDFEALEDGIKNVQKIVDQAISSQNYQEMSNSITDMVNVTIKQYQKTNLKSQNSSRSVTITSNTGKKTPVVDMPEKKSKTQVNSGLYSSLGGERIKNVFLLVSGGIISLTTGCSLLIWELLHSLAGYGGSAFGNMAGLLLGVVLLGSGVKGFGMLRRFKKYVRVLGDKTYCDLETLGKAVGRSTGFVRKDLKSMIRKGWFLEGNIDKQETCLITSRETWQQYENTQKALEEKKNLEAKAEASKKALTPEVQKILAQGDEYLAQIRKCNDDIPGEEISAKIYQMEQIVDQIFDRVEKQPDSVSELNRLMNYYLPTTIKLLRAYAEMDRQAIQGETIQNSKKEIENSIDTLNNAFEKLLDSAFRDTAMDVSSDISVLHTMLAQEGLAGSDFDQKNKGE